MTDERIPTWLMRHLDEALPNDTHFLNARALKRGQYLVNTSDGAVLVRKTSVGEPHVWHLPVPEPRFDFTCRVCNDRMALVHTEFPRDVYCINCGTPYLIDGDGTVLRAGEPAALVPREIVETPIVEFDEKVEAAPAPAPKPAPRKAPSGPYKHGDYTLHSRDVTLATGGQQTIYFFAKKKPKSGEPCAMPDGYEVGVNERTGLPFLRRTGPHEKKSYKPQCQAITAAGDQCKNSARGGSKYCASHKGYRPPARAEAKGAKDTKPRVRKAEDTLPSTRRSTQRDKTYRPQCQALTADGKQCKNSARGGSKYCGSHKGYRPPAAAVATGKTKDTKPRVRKAKDTAPSSRAA